MARFPPIHNNPCDRMIIATAQKHRLATVTTDPSFEGYDIKKLCLSENL